MNTTGRSIVLTASLCAMLLTAIPAFAQVKEMGTKVPSLDELRQALGGGERVIVSKDAKHERATGNTNPPQGIASASGAIPAAPYSGLSIPIKFALNSADVSREFTPHLSQIATYLKSAPDVSIRIIGHADGRGAEQDNLVLSQRRARSVMSMLVFDFGVPQNQVAAEGQGESQPLYNDIYDPRNRRVEFHRQ